jgi:uncharacterized protein
VHARAAELISLLDLRPHPEGGYYREVFRAESRVVRADGGADRSALTTIFFLLPEHSCSRWHQVDSDEVWHLYEGGPLELFEMDPSAEELKRHRLAPVSGIGDGPVYTIPTRNWQAARTLSTYALVGCTVGPGFEFSDYRLLADDPVRAAAVRAAWPELVALV